MSQIYWRQHASAPSGRPCLFLDRDGVVVQEVGYLHRREDVRLIAGAAALIAHARTRGFAVGLVTNQAGIGRGYYTWDDFEAVQDAITEQLGQGPNPFDFVAACAVHPDASLAQMRVADHPWRKPNSGMLTMAMTALDIVLPDSIMVGDQVSDLQAGSAAGVGRIAHVLTGHGLVNRHRCETFAKELGLGGPRVVWADCPVTLSNCLEW